MFPDQPASGRTPLSRPNSGGADHADAISNLSRYFQDVVLGFPGPAPQVRACCSCQSFRTVARVTTLCSPRQDSCRSALQLTLFNAAFILSAAAHVCTQSYRVWYCEPRQ